MEIKASESQGLVSTRTMEMVVALILMIVGIIIIYDAIRLGAGWSEIGPGSGFFPFYVGLLLAASSAGTLVFNLVSHRLKANRTPFVSRESFGRVLRVLIPTTVFIFAIPFIGTYVAAGLFIAFFMWFNGNYAPWKAIPAGVAIPVFLYFLFERWFLVPLPKGPVEQMLGI